MAIALAQNALNTCKWPLRWRKTLPTLVNGQLRWRKMLSILVNGFCAGAKGSQHL